MSSISGVSSYNKSALYQWQNQKLSKASTDDSSQSGVSSLSGSTSMTSQVSSMVDLTKYAMNAMGVDSNSRVTFNQITKYRDKLTTEFNDGVKDGLAKLGVSDPSGVTFTVGADGTLTAASSNATDQANAQAWLASSGTSGKELREALTAAGVSSSTSVSMKVDSTGKLTAVTDSGTDAQTATTVQGVLDSSSLGTTLYSGMESIGVSADAKFTLKANEDGTVTVESSDPDTKAKVQKYLDSNPELEKKFSQISALSGLDDARASLQVSPTEMRKRIEVESIASWWSSSDNSESNSYFGSYSNNSLSMYSGVNRNV